MSCSVEDCDGKVSARTWCEKHYYRWYRHGDLDYFPPVWLDAGPLVTAVESRGITVFGKVSESDRRAWYRAKRSGRVSDRIADRLAVKLLRMTLDELYGYDWDEVAA